MSIRLPEGVRSRKRTSKTLKRIAYDLRTAAEGFDAIASRLETTDDSPESIAKAADEQYAFVMSRPIRSYRMTFHLHEPDGEK